MPVGKRFAKLAAVFATFFLRGLGNCCSVCAGFDIFCGSKAWVSWGEIILVGFEFWLGCAGGGGGGGDDGVGGGDGHGCGGA